MEAFAIIAIFIAYVLINSKISKFNTEMNLKLFQMEQVLKKLSEKLDSHKINDTVTHVHEKIVTEPKVYVPVVEIEVPEQVVISILEEEPIVIKTSIEQPQVIASKKEPLHMEVKRTVNSYDNLKMEEKGYWDNFKEKNPDLEQFIGENLINKIGILILILGVSYFVKYSIDKNWINEWGRVGIALLSGVLVFGIAHYLRDRYRAFSSVLVVGAIVIFYFAIYMAFQYYHLMPQIIAFGILVMITVFSTFVSLNYDRQTLAIMSVLGGFVVPFLVSTGDGNYIVLFTYIILIDIGFLCVSYFKDWSITHSVSFGLTALLFGFYLHTNATEKIEELKNLMLFASIIYLVFLTMTIVKTKKLKSDITQVDSSLYLANTFTYYISGITILEFICPDFKGAFTVVLALVNFILGWIALYRMKLNPQIIYTLLGLCVSFATLAVPIQFEGMFVTVFWAFEGAFLIWLWSKSDESILLFSSVIIYVLATCSLIYFYCMNLGSLNSIPIIFNKVFITGLSLCLSYFFSAYFLKNKTEVQSKWGFEIRPLSYQNLLVTLGFLLLYAIGLIEVVMQANLHLIFGDSQINYIVVYHFTYTLIILITIVYRDFETYFKYGTILIYLNLLIYFLVLMMLPFNEIKSLFYEGTTSMYSRIFNPIFVLFLVSFIYLLLRIKARGEAFILLNKKSQTYSFSLLLILFLSSQVLQYGLMIGLQRMGYTVENYDYIIAQNFKGLLTITWGLIAFGYIFYGLKNQWRNLRIIALCLLAITILKLFSFDIKNISQTGKILSFIVLGILILVISFLYQKIKRIFIDEKGTKK